MKDEPLHENAPFILPISPYGYLLVSGVSKACDIVMSHVAIETNIE